MNVVQYTRTDRRKIRNRAAILDAAEHAFTLHGYRGARIEDIAEAADVSVGSLYTHFGNKDGLYLGVVERATELFATYLDRAYQPEWSPLEQVGAAGDAYLRFHIEHPGAFRFLAFDGVESRLPAVDPAARDRVGDRIAATLDAFQAKIQEAIDAGEIDDRVDAKLASRFLWGAWNGTVALGLRTDRLALSEDEISACLERARRLVLEGLSTPGRRAADGHTTARLVRITSPSETPNH
ncbi:TetR/AcrR family transcriptional regulator [Mycobacterium spongiae]|uniref:TetR family transcriptional regulator n=1 Tax=Mycobacterium spongiae TaxID=886343 RepID=A0A975JY28_9MYCO|nr:TetR/AcrR family transcriptional regulator [Mycobacterium spongiae]QUR67809.1 TetR family transcriptional regulator [Mycobacterium spongiae]